MLSIDRQADLMLAELRRAAADGITAPDLYDRTRGRVRSPSRCADHLRARGHAIVALERRLDAFERAVEYTLVVDAGGGAEQLELAA